MDDPIVTIQSGKVVGSYDDGVYSFKGIPYGAPTRGERRFMAPVPPQPWGGLREAKEYGPSCPQLTELVFNVTEEIASIFGMHELPAQGEDCLVLNVWTQGLGSDSPRPVMFWCHGGGFAVGSATEPFYDGAALARRGDVVVVTVNHRLGPLGYLHLADLGGERYAASGVAGMLDLVLALEWVRDNVPAFGGDPHNVTIFGESGGGAKVSVLLAMPGAQGLFHKAIIQSGPGVRMHSRKKANGTARKVLRQLKVRPDQLERLHELPAQALVAAQMAITRRNPYFILEPVVDGTFLPHSPFEPQAPAISAHVPLIIGTNRDEATLFAGNIPLLGTYSEESFLARLVMPLVLRLLAGKPAPRIIKAARAAHPSASTPQLFSSITSDWVMRMGSILLAERKLAGGGAPVYMYRFDWSSPALGGRLRAHHALDIPFVFDNTAQTPIMTPDSDPVRALAAQVSAAWIAFARDGDPNHPGLPSWQPYTLEQRATMLFDIPCRSQDDPNREERIAWQGARLMLM